MLSNKTWLAAADDSNQTPAVFFCPTEPIYTWILSDTATFQAVIITSSIACPIVILLNIIIIIAVKKRRELQTNSNILLASLAAGDFLVGAISMPLTISLDALLLQKHVGSFICNIAFTNQLIMYAVVCSSLYHLTVIAWERYVAIRKWASYKVIVTRKRIKTFAGISWLLAVLTTCPARILTALGVDYNYLEIVDLVLTLPAVVCLVLIGYFYIMVYLGVRKRRVNDSSQLQGPTSTIAQRERGICKKLFIQTVALLISIVPSCRIVLFLGGALPFLRTSSFFRWTELLSQLNSLLNPFLYFLAIQRFRKVLLEMLKIRKPEMEFASGEGRRRVRRISAGEILEDVIEFEQGQKQKVFAGSGSCQSNMLGVLGDTVALEPVMERSPSTLTCEDNHAQKVRVDVHQPKLRRRKTKIHAYSVIIKGIFSEAAVEPQSSRNDVKTRSLSCDEIAIIEDSSTLGMFETEERRQRSKTMPSSHRTIVPEEDVWF